MNNERFQEAINELAKSCADSAYELACFIDELLELSIERDQRYLNLRKINYAEQEGKRYIRKLVNTGLTLNDAFNRLKVAKIYNHV